MFNTDMTRHKADMHVMSSDADYAAVYSAYMDTVKDFDGLIAIIKLLSPTSSVIEVPTSFDTLPSTRIIRMVDEHQISKIVGDLNISSMEAAGYLILKGENVEPSLSFLRAIPPPEVHAMQRGAYWIGDTYSSDLIVASLNEAGVILHAGMKMIDYGGSSGSLVRVLATTYPTVYFTACDPVRSSIDWAQNNLIRSNLEFSHQNQRPPLPFADSEFDVASAVSVWSHHGINASKAWFDEIYRILKPGGVLVFTTHGIGSILHYVRQARNPILRFKELYAAYLASGFVFEEVWIDEDDQGNIATAMEWGNSYYDPKIVTLLISSKFDIVKIFLRANQSNQDVYVVRKRA